MATREDVEDFYEPGKFWAGSGEPILVESEPISVEFFWNKVLTETKRGRGFAKHLDSPENRAVVVAEYKSRFPLTVVVVLGEHWMLVVC